MDSTGPRDSAWHRSRSSSPGRRRARDVTRDRGGDDSRRRASCSHRSRSSESRRSPPDRPRSAGRSRKTRSHTRRRQDTPSSSRLESRRARDRAGSGYRAPRDARHDSRSSAALKRADIHWKETTVDLRKDSNTKPATEIILKSDHRYGEAADRANRSKGTFEAQWAGEPHGDVPWASNVGGTRAGRGCGGGRGFWGRNGEHPSSLVEETSERQSHDRDELGLGGHEHHSKYQSQTNGRRRTNWERFHWVRDVEPEKDEAVQESSRDPRLPLLQRLRTDTTNTPEGQARVDKEHSPFGPNGSMSSSQTADLGLATPEDYDESLRAKRRAERTDPRERAWYYIDPEGHTQGPCSVVEFEQWLKRMASDRSLLKEYKEFQEVSVWTEAMTRRIPMLVLLALHQDTDK